MWSAVSVSNAERQGRVSPQVLTPDVIRLAVVQRDREAVRLVVRSLTPIIRFRATRSLVRARGKGGSAATLRDEVDDVTQDVFVRLLADGGRRLLAWSPERGSASAFFGVLAQRLVINALQARRNRPWRESEARDGDLDVFAGAEHAPDTLAASREELRALGERLMAGLSERDQTLFGLIYITQADDAAIRGQMGLSRDALYQCRRRLKQRVRALVGEGTP